MFWVQFQHGFSSRIGKIARPALAPPTVAFSIIFMEVPYMKDVDNGQPILNYQDPEALLFEAIIKGDLSRVKQLISSGIDKNTVLHSPRRWEGATVLGTAAYEGHLDIIEYLLEMKTAINFRDPCLGRTALHWACMGKKVDVVRYLIKHGADINCADRDNVTPIIIVAINKLYEICKVLIDNGANVNQVDRLCSSPLHYACNHGDHKLINEIIKSGCIKNNLGIIGKGTPLANLVHYNNTESCILLLEAGYSLENEKWLHSNELETNKATSLVLQRIKNPSTLKSLCRMRIRIILGGTYLRLKIQTLTLPDILMLYLLLENL